MKVVPLRVGLTSKTNQSLKRGFLIKFLLNFTRLVKIGCLTLSLKRKFYVVHQARKQLVDSVARRIVVIN